MESTQDPELGLEENLLVTPGTPPYSFSDPEDNNSSLGGFEEKILALEERLLATPPEWQENPLYSFSDPEDGFVHIIPNDVGELLPTEAYVQQESDEPHVRELKTEVGRLLSQFAAYRAWLIAHEKCRRLRSFLLTFLPALHWMFLSVMCVVVLGGFVDCRPWSIAFCLLVTEIAACFVVLLWRIIILVRHDICSEPDEYRLKLNFQRMPAVKARLGEQEFENFVVPLQEAFDHICETLDPTLVPR